MKKVTLLTVVLFAGFTATAFAGSIKTGQTASCNDAKSITISVAKIANKNGGKWGYSTNDRGNGNVVVWKSSNATTVPTTTEGIRGLAISRREWLPPWPPYGVWSHRRT